MKKIINRQVVDFLKPQIIYVPLQKENDYEYELLVKMGSYVYKNSRIAYDKKRDIYIYSSISGYTVNIVPKYTKEGTMIKCLLIENDFKEKSLNRIGKKNDIKCITKELFISLLKGYSIIGNKSNELIYKKYQKKRVKYLFINGVECESGLFSDKVLMLNYPEEILDSIDAIIEIMNIKEAIIVLKLTDDRVTEEFKKYIGSYPKIKIFGVPDNYPSGSEQYIVEYLLNNYERNSYIIDNVSTIYTIYEMLKYGKPQTERLISLNGNGLKKNICCKVKLYSSFEEIIYHTNGYKVSDEELINYCLIAGSLERGKSIPTDELIVTPNLEGISVIKNDNEKKYRCINCGNCANLCPVGINPALVIKNKKDKKKLKKLKYDKCINCGLCSRVCPSRIEIFDIIKEIKGDK